MTTNFSHKNLIKILNKYNCLISAAHPFSIGKSGLHKIKGHHELDIIEGINGRLTISRNKKALNLKNKIFTGGSDSHSKNYIGRIVTGSKSKTVKGFLDSIKKSKHIVIGKEIPLSDLFFNLLKSEISLAKELGIKNFLKRRYLKSKNF